MCDVIMTNNCSAVRFIRICKTHEQGCGVADLVNA